MPTADTMSLQTARDVPLQIRSESSASERRISPSWTLAHLKTKLEPITGIPPSNQKLTLKISGRPEAIMHAVDEDAVQLVQWDLLPYSEIYVSSVRL